MKTGKFTLQPTRRCFPLLAEDAREKIYLILGKQIQFEGHFDKVFEHLSEPQQQSILSWVDDCKKGKVLALSSDKIPSLIGFVLKFNQTNFRAILTKKNNEYFIALFLDKHKYYENERRTLGI